MNNLICKCPYCGQNCYTPQQLESHIRAKKYHEKRKNMGNKSLEFQITVWKDANGNMWYTAWKRKIRFILRDKWVEINPINQESYEKAVVLTASYINHK